MRKGTKRETWWALCAEGYTPGEIVRMGDAAGYCSSDVAHEGRRYCLARGAVIPRTAWWKREDEAARRARALGLEER